MKKKREAAIRLAIRTESSWIVAYFSEPGNMDRAIEIGRISIAAALEDGGSEGPLFQAWKETLSEYLTRISERVTGIKILEIIERKAPSHERIQ